MLKRLLNALAPYLIVAVIWVVGLTTRKRLVNWHVIETLAEQGRPCILGVWHNNILFFIHFLGKLRIAAMISKSRDGDRITQIARPFGIHPVRGSTSRAALSAVRESMRVLRQGRHLAITPDGPRGPRYVVQPGLVGLAQMAGVPVVPICWATPRRWEADTWDRIKLPKPFATVTVMVGDPIPIGREEDPEAARRRVEQAMRRLVRQAERFCGTDLPDREPLIGAAEDEKAAAPTTDAARGGEPPAASDPLAG